MSSKGSKGAKAKWVDPVVPEPLPPVTSYPEGLIPDVPFPEWTDDSINAEKWDLPKGKDAGKGKAPAAALEDEPAKFLDPQLFRMPHSLPVIEWKRPAEVFPEVTIIMFSESSEYSNLITGSKHLLHSEFMRSYISAIGILEYLGDKHPFDFEFQTPNFIPSTVGKPWRPWHHIYSMCKAGKGAKHLPQVNTLGKYVVRLFWLGCWRRVTVDDCLPTDLTHHVQLPVLDKPPKFAAPPKGGKAPPAPAVPIIEVELWPLLLCKALLKVACLTWTQYEEIKDFDIIECLTGWFVQKVHVSDLEMLDVWEMCKGYSDHYTWPSKDAPPSSAKSSKTSAKTVPNFLSDKGGEPPFHLVATFSDMRSINENEVPDIAPCWSHPFLIDQTRNIPLVEPQPLSELAKWKRFRWFAWAVRKGIWPAPIPPIKCFKMVSVFRKCADHVIYNGLSKEAVDLQKSVTVIEELALQEKGKTESKATTTATSKSGEVPAPPDPSLWVDFEKIACFIDTVMVYFKPSQFDTHYKITDMRGMAPKKDAGKAPKPVKGKAVPTGPKLITWYNELLESRNEPLCIFIDSLEHTLMLVNLSQVGNAGVFDQSPELGRFSIASDMIYSLEGFLPKRSNNSCNLLELLQEACIPELLQTEPQVPSAHVVFERYTWQDTKYGEAAMSINTCGSRTMIFNVRPGRNVFRVWIRTDNYYYINLLSDTPIVVGSLEEVLEEMTHEPERLLKLCNTVSVTYGQLVQAFGMPEFPQALQEFCKSYIPETKLAKPLLDKVHNAFIDTILNFSKQSCLDPEFSERVFALKVLFLNPSIGHPVRDSMSQLERIFDWHEDTASSRCSYIDDIKTAERAAVTLQAFFKKIFIRKLKALRHSSNPRYLKIFEVLKKTYTDIFSIGVRMSSGPKLIREFILSNTEMSAIRFHYSVFNDLMSCIHLQHFKGNIFAPATSWVPITRVVFYVNSPESVTVKICLFCLFSHFNLRVFNNDDGKEFTRFTNNVGVCDYSCNELGYTVVAYGWSGAEGDYPWKLDLITMKTKDTSLVFVPPVGIVKNILQKNYRPNVNNLICRCLVRIEHDVLATFRLSTCYDAVKLRFRCLSESGELLGEVTGIGSAVLPAIILKYVESIIENPLKSPRAASLVSTSSQTEKRRRRSSSVDKRSISSSKRSVSEPVSVKFKDNTFILEGYVVDDSWPLTKPEWDVVDEVKTSYWIGPHLREILELPSTMSFSQMVGSRTSFGSKKVPTKKRASQAEAPEIVNRPLWYLQTVSNAQENLMAVVDTRREEEIRNTKIKWYEDDPDRYYKSMELRQEYLESHYQTWEPSDFLLVMSDSCDLEKAKRSSSIIPVVGQSTEIFMHEFAVQEGRSNISITVNEENYRSLKKPIPYLKTLPQFDLKPYYRPIPGFEYMDDDEDEDIERHVKTREEEEELIMLRAEAIATWQDSQDFFMADMKKLMEDQTSAIRLMEAFFNECRSESKLLMDQAIEAREAVIDEIIAIDLANQLSPKKK